ncbi:MAG: thioredoxin domain-containing protein [Myxococcota bacterium]
MRRWSGTVCAVVLALTSRVAPVAAADDADARALAVPGFDFSKLPGPAKKELVTVLTDEFDYCGRPLTLLASLKKGDACKHTRRLVGHAATLAAEGSPASEIILSLSKYNQSFTKGRASLKVDERTCQGPKDAKVTLVEFSDFECPFCAAARPVLEQVVKAKSSVRLCWAPFPLQQHPHSTLAGQAALFARDHGKFWQMHDALFDAQLSMSESTIKGLVVKLGLDLKAFEKAAAANKYLDELNASKEAGKLAGVESTPSLYVNGRKFSLGLSGDTLSLTIDDELEWLAGSNAWPSN